MSPNQACKNLSISKKLTKPSWGVMRQYPEDGFEVEAVLKGETARDLNRMLLSELRRAEKRTRIRAEWTSGSTIKKFFDYVPKGTRRLNQEGS